MRKVDIIIFLFCAILMPPLEISSDLPVVRAEFIYVIFLIITGRVKIVSHDYVINLFKALIVIICISIAISYFYFRVNVLFNDYMFLVTIAQYWAIYSFAISINKDVDRVYAIKIISIFVAISGAIGIMQKYGVIGINSWLTPLYVLNEFAITALEERFDFARSTGTVGDPRLYAYMLTIGVGASLAMVLKYNNKSDKYIYIITLFVTLLSIPFAASRTSILVVLVLLLMMYYQLRKNSSLLIKNILIILAVLPALVFVYNNYVPESSRERIADIDAVSYERSKHARQRDTMEPFKKSFKDPIILFTGAGPQKSVLPGGEHSDIGWMTLHYGLPGLLCYILIVYGTYRTAIKYKNITDLSPLYYMAFVNILTAWLVFMLAESIFRQMQLMSINIFVLGLIHSLEEKGRKILDIKYQT